MKHDMYGSPVIFSSGTSDTMATALLKASYTYAASATLRRFLALSLLVHSLWDIACIRPQAINCQRIRHCLIDFSLITSFLKTLASLLLFIKSSMRGKLVGNTKCPQPLIAFLRRAFGGCVSAYRSPSPVLAQREKQAVESSNFGRTPTYRVVDLGICTVRAPVVRRWWWCMGRGRSTSGAATEAVVSMEQALPLRSSWLNFNRFRARGLYSVPFSTPLRDCQLLFNAKGTACTTQRVCHLPPLSCPCSLAGRLHRTGSFCRIQHHVRVHRM